MRTPLMFQSLHPNSHRVHRKRAGWTFFLLEPPQGTREGSALSGHRSSRFPPWAWLARPLSDCRLPRCPWDSDVVPRGPGQRGTGCLLSGIAPHILPPSAEAPFTMQPPFLLEGWGPARCGHTKEPLPSLLGAMASGLRLVRSARALARVPEAGQPNPRPASQTDGKGARASGRLPELGHIRSGPQGQWRGAGRKQGRS